MPNFPRKPIEQPGARGATHFHRTKTGTIHYDSPTQAPANPVARFANANAVASEFASRKLSVLSNKQAQWLMRESMRHGNNLGQQGAKGNVVDNQGNTTGTWQMSLRPDGSATFQTQPLRSVSTPAPATPTPPQAQPVSPTPAPSVVAPDNRLGDAVREALSGRLSRHATQLEAGKGRGEFVRAMRGLGEAVKEKSPEELQKLGKNPQQIAMALMREAGVGHVLDAPAAPAESPPASPPSPPPSKSPEPEGEAGNDGEAKDHYMVPAEALPRLQKQIETLARKAAKLGLPPISLEVLGKEEKEVTDADGRVHHFVRHQVRVKGGQPKINGWDFIGTIEHAGEAGNLVNAIPNEKIPGEYRTTDATQCDHCRKPRRRNKAYILRQGATHKQVGSNCLKDFVGGHGDPQALAAYAEDFIKAEKALSEADEEGNEWGEGTRRNRESWLTENYLGHVAETIKRHGWMSKGKARENNVLSTSEGAWENMNDHANKSPKAYAPSAESKALGKKALEWARQKYGDYDGDEDFKWNMRLLTQHGTVDRKGAGIVAYVLQHHLEETEKERRKAEEEAGRQRAMSEGGVKSPHLGAPGEAITARLKVTGMKTIPNNYGPRGGVTTIVSFVDKYGRRAKWFSSGSVNFQEGKVYNLKAKVKDNGSWDNTPETSLTHVKAHPLPEEKARVAAARDNLGRAEAEHTLASEEYWDAQNKMRDKHGDNSWYMQNYPPGHASHKPEHWNHPDAAALREKQAKMGEASTRLSQARYDNITGETGEVPNGFDEPEEAPPTPKTKVAKAAAPKPASAPSTPAKPKTKQLSEHEQRIADTKAHIAETEQKIAEIEAAEKPLHDASHKAYADFQVAKDADRKSRNMQHWEKSPWHHSEDFEPYKKYMDASREAGKYYDDKTNLQALKGHLGHQLKQHQLEGKEETPERNEDLALHKWNHMQWLSRLPEHVQKHLLGRSVSWQEVNEAQHRFNDAERANRVYQAKKKLGKA